MKFTVFVICMIISYQLFGQLQEAHTIGETTYRYTSPLYEDYHRFSQIRLQYLNFPCAEEFLVSDSNIPDVTYMLSAGTNKEYYKLKGTVLYLKGTLGSDPFGLSNRVRIIFEKPLPITRSTHKDDFFERVEQTVTINLAANDLETSLKKSFIDSDVDSILIDATHKWKAEYKHKDSFNNFEEDINGFVVAVESTFQPNGIKVKKNGYWQNPESAHRAILGDFISTKKQTYLSFFDYRNLAELARINKEPQISFMFHAPNILGRLQTCNNDGPDVYVFPNPTFDNVNVKFQDLDIGQYTFSLRNIIGKTIWSKNIIVRNMDTIHPVNLPQLSKGVYLYRITAPNGKIIQAKRLMIMEL